MNPIRAHRVSPIHAASIIDEAVTDAINAGVVMQTANAGGYTGQHVCIDSRSLLNFGACSYLALERRSELREGAEAALRETGTQFPFPRAFLQSPLYVELEANLSTITGCSVLVASNTTLGHISALPVLVEPCDAVIVDQFAHSSLQTAVELLRGITVEQVRHSRIKALQILIERMSRSHERIWYVCDGLYSMLGDLAPLEALAGLLEKFPKLHLYIDDAHSTSWAGTRGRGQALECLAGHDRVIVTLSLNKAFSAAGGAIVFPNPDLYGKVRRCGGPMIFSGPIQPPMLGAAVASSRLHLAPEFSSLQAAEQERIRLALSLARDYQIVLGSDDETPIYFVPCGPEPTAFELVRSMRRRGFYACPAAFPAVPRNRAGIRFTISLHNEVEDIHAFMSALGEETRRLGLTSGHRGSGTQRIS